MPFKAASSNGQKDHFAARCATSPDDYTWLQDLVHRLAYNGDGVTFKWTALKNSQLTCGDITIICETVH